jgi:sarcosine oxidase delta subunit
MSFELRLRHILIALALAAGWLAMVAQLGDEARAGGEACPAKTLCVWEHNEGAGQLVKIAKDGISNKLAEKMNNGASSVINNRNKRAYLYDRRNGKGTKVCLSPGAEVGDLGSFADFNDLASSSKNTDRKSDCPTLWRG